MLLCIVGPACPISIISIPPRLPSADELVAPDRLRDRHSLLLPYLITPLYLFVHAGLDADAVALSHRSARGAHRAAARAISPAVPLRRDRVRGCSASARMAASTGPNCATAIEEAEDIEDLRGGSTITQQTVKNLFLWPGRSYVRKALELPLSAWVDLILPKRRIMELYLNVAEWGPNGEFGVEAGSRRAFSRRRAILAIARRLCWRPSCPIRRSAMPASRGRAVRRLAGDLRAPGHGRRRPRRLRSRAALTPSLISGLPL